MNNKVDKSQVIVLFVLALLLIFIPLLPSSMRPSYLYFIFNVLIIALGAEAGLLSAFSNPSEDRSNQPVSVTQKPVILQETQKKEASSINHNASDVSEQNEKNKPKVFGKSASEKINGVIDQVDYRVKKCTSVPSIFYIEGEESDSEVNMNEEEVIDIDAEDEVGGVDEQELFANAEAFIGNFYKHLKMQREISQE